MTDKSDYAPGSIVTITGTGWQPGETVILQLVESPLVDTPSPITAVADANGNIFNNQFSPDQYDVDISFTLTATGNSSGLQAQTTFTDAAPTLTMTISGNGNVSAVRSSGSGTILSCTGSCTFSNSGTPQATCSSGTCVATWSANYSATLTATSSGGYSFDGWSGTGGCAGTGTCSASASGNNGFIATATFTAITKLVFTSVNGGSNPTAGAPFSVVVQAQDTSGNPGSVVSNTGVTLSLHSGTGTLGGTLSGTITAGTNSVTISGVTYTKAESGVSLTATRTSGDSLAAGNSATFTANPGAASKLAFNQQPSTTTAGQAISPALTVLVEDANGNVVTTNSSNVTITISSGGAFSTGSTTTVAASSGVATFTNLVPTVAGSFTLFVADGSLTGATSNSFTVNVAIGRRGQVIVASLSRYDWYEMETRE